MADVYLGFGLHPDPVHHSKSVRSNINLDYARGSQLTGVEVLGVDRFSVDGRELDHLLDKERLAEKIQVIGESLGLFPYVAGKQMYCQDAMMFAERILGEW